MTSRDTIALGVQSGYPTPSRASMDGARVGMELRDPAATGRRSFPA
jgi:hypothetical protein